jgi:hypothetical protein
VTPQSPARSSEAPEGSIQAFVIERTGPVVIESRSQAYTGNTTGTTPITTVNGFTGRVALSGTDVAWLRSMIGLLRQQDLADRREPVPAGATDLVLRGVAMDVTGDGIVIRP